MKKLKMAVDKMYRDTKDTPLSEVVETVTISITITEDRMRKAMALGNGNRSLGIRRALDAIELEDE